MGKHSRTHITEEEADQLLNGIRALKEKKQEQKAERVEVRGSLREMQAAGIRSQGGN